MHTLSSDVKTTLNAITDENVEPKCCWKPPEILNKMTVSVGGFVSKKLSSRFVEIHAAAVEEESYPEMEWRPGDLDSLFQRQATNLSQVVSFLSFSFLSPLV